MTRDEQTDYVADGLSAERRQQFLAGDAAVHAWAQTHPMGLDDYFDFLEGLQTLFGPFSVQENVWPGNDFRL